MHRLIVGWSMLRPDPKAKITNRNKKQHRA
jgi:hypothetical protein